MSRRTFVNDRDNIPCRRVSPAPWPGGDSGYGHGADSPEIRKTNIRESWHNQAPVFGFLGSELTRFCTGQMRGEWWRGVGGGLVTPDHSNPPHDVWMIRPLKRQCLEIGKPSSTACSLVWKFTNETRWQKSKLIVVSDTENWSEKSLDTVLLISKIRMYLHCSVHCTGSIAKTEKY